MKIPQFSRGPKFACLGILLACAFVAAPRLSAQESSAEVRPPKLNFTTHKLGNGLDVVLLEEHSVPVINLQVWYHVGGKDELPGHTGFAHLFEHLMFKGSAHVGPDEHSRIIEAVGGFDNAETGDDTTNFFETFPSNYLERVLWLEADRMGSLNVDDANFKSERKVVEEERRVRVDNEPYGTLEEDLRSAAFTVHGYHHTPIGSIQDLENATLQDVRDFFNTYYKPNNATLVIVGDFNSEQALGWTKKYFEGIPASAQPIPRHDTPEPVQTAERDVKKSYSNTPLPAIVIGYKIPARYQPDAYPLDLASNILAGGESSRLYQALVYKDQIAVQAGGFGNFSEDPNLFWAYAIMNRGHSADEGDKAIVNILDGLKEAPVDAKELEKAKNQEVAGFILGRDTDEQKAVALASAAVIGKDPGLVNTELDRYLKASAADIQRVAKDYFVPEHSIVLTITPAARGPRNAPGGAAPEEK
ncbi:MAG TPA: pitrilysin family protein [Candidatus Acidoferrales bacterium]|jgi:zinc protease|nr:pitrilysin family protein [Candidatus Acidoferrales bacterium]